eukprot:scaffold27608_cov73-Cyclotella_meneghiniana.AAC.7
MQRGWIGDATTVAAMMTELSPRLLGVLLLRKLVSVRWKCRRWHGCVGRKWFASISRKVNFWERRLSGGYPTSRHFWGVTF